MIKIENENDPEAETENAGGKERGNVRKTGKGTGLGRYGKGKETVIRIGGKETDMKVIGEEREVVDISNRYFKNNKLSF